MSTDEERVKAAVKGRQAMDATMKKNMAAKLRAAATITEFWRHDLPVALLVGVICLWHFSWVSCAASAT